MTTLTGRPGNFIRISESQYQADIDAAEKRGRASAAQAATNSATPVAATPPTVAPKTTPEQEAAMAELKVLQEKAKADAQAKNAHDPKALTAYVAEQKAKGRTIGFAQAAQELSR
jgi:hypothetical protein